MRADLLTRLREQSRDQFGLVTTDQAHAAGVTDEQLGAAAAGGEVWPVADEVWAVCAAEDKHEFEDWAAVWLTVNATTSVNERRQHPDALITHESAAVLRELGAANSYQLTLTMHRPPEHPVRGARIVAGRIGAHTQDWTVVHGLPTATPARIITDLAADGADGSHLGTIIDDCLTRRLLDVSDVAAILAPHLHRWSGDRTNDPREVIELLISGATDPADG